MLTFTLFYLDQLFTVSYTYCHQTTKLLKFTNSVSDYIIVNVNFQSLSRHDYDPGNKILTEMSPLHKLQNNSQKNFQAKILFDSFFIKNTGRVLGV